MFSLMVPLPRKKTLKIMRLMDESILEMWLYAMFLVVSSASAEYCGNSTGNHSNCSSSVRYVCQDGCVASIDICQFGCASGECLFRPNVTYPPPIDEGPMLRFLAITAAILFSVL